MTFLCLSVPAFEAFVTSIQIFLMNRGRPKKDYIAAYNGTDEDTLAAVRNLGFNFLAGMQRAYGTYLPPNNTVLCRWLTREIRILKQDILPRLT